MVQANTTFNAVHQLIANQEPERDGLLTGRLGLCLYYYCVYQTLNHAADAEKAVNHLSIVFEHWNSGDSTLRGNAYSYGGAAISTYPK